MSHNGYQTLKKLTEAKKNNNEDYEALTTTMQKERPLILKHTNMIKGFIQGEAKSTEPAPNG